MCKTKNSLSYSNPKQNKESTPPKHSLTRYLNALFSNFIFLNFSSFGFLIILSFIYFKKLNFNDNIKFKKIININITIKKIKKKYT